MSRSAPFMLWAEVRFSYCGRDKRDRKAVHVLRYQGQAHAWHPRDKTAERRPAGCHAASFRERKDCRRSLHLQEVQLLPRHVLQPGVEGPGVAALEIWGSRKASTAQANQKSGLCLTEHPSQPYTNAMQQNSHIAR